MSTKFQLGNIPRLSLTTVILISVLGIAACGKTETRAGQALAKVNGDEITVSQINAELAQLDLQSLSDKQKSEMQKKVLDALIDRQLLVEEAMRSKTDRDPEVIQVIERAKDQILAQAYIRAKLAKLSPPSKEEVEQYYQQHPELFIQRKTYQVKEVVISAGDFNEALQAFLKSSRTLDEITAWLDAHKLKYARSQSLHNSTDIPTEVLDKLDTAKPDDIFSIKNGANYSLSTFTYVKDSPMSFENARSAIERYLSNTKAEEMAKSEIARLRASAKVEYASKEASNDNATANTTAGTQVNAESNKPDIKPSNYMENGVKGLK
jgi:peptidyl-prolyl cis-trans isomerase C